LGSHSGTEGLVKFICKFYQIILSDYLIYQILTFKTLRLRRNWGMNSLAKYFIISILFIGFSSFKIADEPTKITWELLRDVTFKKKWSAEESMFILHPTFGAKVTALKNKEVELTGYMIPVDVDANMYVLSANPYSACFFCGQAGPESVVQVKFKKVSKRFNTDDRVTVKGTFVTNADDINEMNYILTNAEVIL
jgi:hypothetical protein